MLIVNLIYSALVSRIRESKLVLVVYGFFVLNLLVFSYLNYYFPESYLLSGSFYVWYNVFNFSVVSVFWARTINSFNYEDGKKYFGIISAFGSAGGFAASQLVLYFLKDEFIFTMILSCMSLILAVYFSTQTSVIKENSSTTHKNNLLDDASEQFKQIKSNVLVRQLLSYVFVWTCLSTALYFFSLEVINAATTKKLFVNLVFVDRSMQAELFALADSIAIPLTLFTQVFLTRFLLQSKFFGIKFVLIFYGAVYAIGFLLMYIYFSQLFLIGSGALVFLIITALVRPYEYAVNKPARETVYTTIEKT